MEEKVVYPVPVGTRRAMRLYALDASEAAKYAALYVEAL